MSGKHSGKHGALPSKGKSIDEGTWKTVEFQEVGTPTEAYQEEPRYLLTGSYYTFIIKQIEGTMLTIADASNEDHQKREAMKSLIRNGIWQCATNVRLLRLEKI